MVEVVVEAVEVPAVSLNLEVNLFPNYESR